MSRSVVSSSSSRMRSVTARRLAHERTEPTEGARKPRLDGAARDAKRVGHLGLRQIEEVAVRDHEPILFLHLAQRAQDQAPPLAGQGRSLGRQGRVYRGAVLNLAETDRRTAAGRLAAVDGL